MDENFTTTARNDSKDAGIDSSGKIIKTTGYTSTKQIKKNQNGHYDLNSPEEIEVDSNNCYAKSSEVERPDGKHYSKYYVKSSSDGSIFDPWGMFSEGTQGDYSQGRGKMKWTFCEVNEKCFNFYINFLQTRNKAWLTNAEREVK